MDHANVKLSKSELSLVTDASFILTKNSIITKVYGIFGQLSDEWQAYTAAKKDKLPAEVYMVSPKIYKGEQYLGLPYVMLDYPRVYGVGNIMAIRCFFWWGNFFSITLHLQGRFMLACADALRAWVKQHAGNEWFIGVNNDAWQHHFGENNYCSLDVMGEDILNDVLASDGGFVKLAKKLPLEQWDDAVQFFTKAYAELMQVLEA
ncbi:MAG TPA: hypothetical protein VG738_08275 [Chitinophagaceae bacterium]|nr:hypothetical protein [Chitinophagaceae bacterium]